MCDYCNPQTPFGDPRTFLAYGITPISRINYEIGVVCPQNEHPFIMYASSEDVVLEIPIEYCPKCGRKLYKEIQNGQSV